MEFMELYIEGNVKGDIEPDDMIIPKIRKSTATRVYDCDKYTDEMNQLRTERRSSGLFITSPQFENFVAPWIV